MNRVTITANCSRDRAGRPLSIGEREAAVRLVRESMGKWLGRYEEFRGRAGGTGEEGECIVWTAYTSGEPMAAKLVAEQAAAALQQDDVVLAISQCRQLERVRPRVTRLRAQPTSSPAAASACYRRR